MNTSASRRVIVMKTSGLCEVRASYATNSVVMYPHNNINKEELYKLVKMLNRRKCRLVDGRIMAFNMALKTRAKIESVVNVRSVCGECRDTYQEEQLRKKYRVVDSL